MKRAGYFLGVDAGGTKTRFLLGDSSGELASAQTGSIKRLRINEESAGQNLDRALHALTESSGIPLHKVVRTCVGIAGNSVPIVSDWIRQAFSARVGGELLLLGDVDIALAAAFGAEPGVVAISGTGSNVTGRNRDGTRASAGGWGPELGDHGSGQSIGREALRACFMAMDEGIDTGLLLSEVMRFWKMSSLSELIEYANSRRTPDFSELAPLVVSCAERGDYLTSKVLQEAGHDLAYLVSLVVKRLRSLSPDNVNTLQVAVAGSILQNVTRVRHSMENALHQGNINVQLVNNYIDPVAGALCCARINYSE